MRLSLERGRRRGADRCSQCNAVITSLRGVRVTSSDDDALVVQCRDCRSSIAELCTLAMEVTAQTLEDAAAMAVTEGRPMSAEILRRDAVALRSHQRMVATRAAIAGEEL